MINEENNVLHVATDRYGRTWRVLDREDAFAVYYTLGADPAQHVIYDSRDAQSDPPRVLLGRATQAERRVLALEAALRQAASMKSIRGARQIVADALEKSR